jgi:tetratricopeptide (TPR) repeat protein
MSQLVAPAITDELIHTLQAGSAQMTEGKATALAIELYGRGKYGQAIKVCQQIIQHRDGNADAHNILGVSLAALGRPKAAVAALQRAIELAPKAANYYSNLGEILRANGDLAGAAVHLSRALELDPSNAQALNNRGIVHYERKEYEAAVESYRKAVELDPAMAEAWNNLGNSLRLVADQAGAMVAYEHALACRENYPEAYNNLGTLLREEGKGEQAEHALRKAIAQNPRYLDAYCNLASILHADGQDVEALRQLAEVLRIAPKHEKTLLLVARVQLKRGVHDLAEQACRIVLQQNARSAEALTVLAQLNHETDNYDTALKLASRAVEMEPDNAEARNFYGVALKSVGRLDEAREQILKAIELNENMFGAYANLNDLVTFDASQPLFRKLSELLDGDGPSSERNLPLHFAYAKALDDVGQHEAALTHYIAGGRLRRAQLNYVESDTFAFFDRIRTKFTGEFIAKPPFGGNPSERPVFIVGMPRSGSTLVEQIVSAHPEVHGAGEVKHLSRQLHLLRDRFPSLDRYPEIVDGMSQAQFRGLADGYLDSLAKQASDAARVTDKLLTNYFFVGLIHILFPNAKIINTVRNPLDNCLSAFTKLFKDDMPHSYDLGELGRYYRKYEELMGHWHQVLPAGVMTTVVYEDVVGDTEKAAKDLISFLGLEWNDACLNFHDSARPVKTASVAQVRKPIYTSAIDRHAKYGAGLDPLREALGMAKRGKRAK